MIVKIWRIVAVTLVTTLSGCGFYGESAQFASDGENIVMTGVVDGRALPKFQQVLLNNPEAQTLILQYIPGSMDDDANLELSKMVHASGLTTIVPSDGMVASGGTDLLAAGKRRIALPGACIGVHSWAYVGLFGNDTPGTSLPRDHEEHRKYENFYRSIGIPPDFYWFTMNAAPPEDIHWMRSDEMNRYRISSRTLGDRWDQVSTEESCDLR